MPKGIRDAIVGAYERLGHDDRVAVRSSATAEDTAATSFAGVNESFTNVCGAAELVDRIVACWASLWSPRAIAYRASQGLTDEPAIAVVVQCMVDADVAGVMFTADPATGDRDHVVIEAAYGLGEVVVAGQVEPDTYILAKDGPRLLHARVGTKATRIGRGPDGHDQRVPVPAADQARRVLDDDAVTALARTAIEVERHYGSPQDMEFAIDGDLVWIVQSRPITTLGVPPSTGTPAASGELVVTGLAAAPGVVSGPVRVLQSPAEGGRLRPGEILVAAMTTPDWVPVMRRATALVTDGGGVTCHAAIVGRELGLPTVVATRTATSALVDGDLVTVDGTTGEVRRGRAPAQEIAGVRARSERGPAPTGADATATLLYVNLAIAERAEDVAALPVDGVGLLRAEFMITDALGGEHPKHLLATGRREEFVSRMIDSVGSITRAFAPRPVIYRTVEFRSNEFRCLAASRPTSGPCPAASRSTAG
jgi:pyruvate,water dikinase